MLSLLDKEIIRYLQEDIPIEMQPFKSIAKKLNVDESEIIERVKFLKDKGMLKRIGAVLYHRKSGFKANAMVVWCVPESCVEYVGDYLSSKKEISHCYERVVCSQWKYNLFTMIHGNTKEQCQKLIEEIAKKININEYKVLYSTKELKKSSMKYKDL
ncbi:AsnC family transcriptional regulator [Clostridium rectalis]|uniref:siroheme decarboxylase subunit beta n=1 Tax=Clostridium rectalis TaxID=2040295 RepID=UPI000F6328A0|nr:AsnC family transcriptional regulator [Clostridium rectalis]